MRQYQRLRVALAVQWAAGAAACALLGPMPWWLAAPAGVLAASIVTALVVGLGFVVAACLDRSARPAGWMPVWIAWGREAGAHLRAFWWLQPFRSGIEHAPIVVDAARPAILLIHGLGCNRAMWLPLLRSGVLAHCNLASIDLEPSCAPIGSHADRIERAVQDLCRSCRVDRVVLLAHSMGGLAMLAYLQRYGDAALRIGITIGTPYHGSVLAHLSPCSAARQMRPGHPWLSDLVGQTPCATRARLLCVASIHDQVVIPRASAWLEQARHIRLAGIGHLSMAMDASVWRRIAREIDANAAPRARTHAAAQGGPPDHAAVR